MKTGIVILAGGKGTRFGGKKQDMIFHGKPLWKHVYDTAATVSDNIVVVGRDIPAGNTRSGSVINGLNALPDDTDMVLLAEAARPLVTSRQMIELLKDEYPSKSFVMPLVNTVIGRDGTYYDRNKMYDLLVPQSFDYSLLKKAYMTGKYSDMTDETKVMFEEYGIKPKLIETSQNLFKVTYQRDIGVIEILYQFMKENTDD